MKINIRNIIPLGIIMVLLFSATSCEDMLSTDSDRLSFEENNTLNNPNDPFYMIAGILREVQKVGDRYVVMGELRGDLMLTSQNASVSLKEVNDFQVSQGNDYLDKRDFYNIINHCNYAIERMDTSIFISNEKVMMPAFAAIKAIRAWTYMQLGLTYGSAIYIEKPILDLESSLATYPTKDLDALLEALVADILPYADVRLPSGNSVPNIFVPIKALLGDIYLYQGKYPQAAEMYYGLIDLTQGYGTFITDNFVNRWTTASNDGVSIGNVLSYRGEAAVFINYSDESGESDPKDLHSRLVGMTYKGNASLLPANSFIESMAAALYYYQGSGGTTTISEGDLRGIIQNRYFNLPSAYGYISLENSTESMFLITKFYHNAFGGSSSGYDPNNNLIEGGLVQLDKIAVLRNVHIYLRYAEAVNRMGKPTLAFAVLKHGLKRATLYDEIDVKVNPKELVSGEPFIDFQNPVFDSNVGTASRGRGLNISVPASTYVIPDFTASATSFQDSINWVEERILEEMAAETSFEGNRFFDLLRVSKRRANHPAFMADMVSRKYDNAAAMRARLSTDINVWFVKP